MKEQVRAPIGEGSDKSEKEGAPKALSKPMLPKGLENVEAKDLSEMIVGWRCGCGLAQPKYGGCQTIPIFAGDGWSGSYSYDGEYRSFTEAERETHHKIGQREEWQ